MRTHIDMIENDSLPSPLIEEVFNSFKVAVAADKAMRSKQIVNI